MNDLMGLLRRTAKYFANPFALGLVLLALSIFFHAATLADFTIELSKVRREMPRVLDRIDLQLNKVDTQLSAINRMVKRSESTGKDFSTGVNKGIAEGIVDLPFNTVSNVGDRLKDTAVKTGSTTVGFWDGLKSKFMFWRSATKEAQVKDKTEK